MTDFQIFCSGCARPISYQTAWRESLSGTKVCGKECCEKVRLDYCRALLPARQ